MKNKIVASLAAHCFVPPIGVRVLCAVLLLPIASCLMTGPVHAATLPAAICTVDPTSTNLSVGPGNTCGPGYAWASAFANNGGYGYGKWSLGYSYEIVGPQTEQLTATVNYYVLATAITNGLGNTSATATTTIGDANGSFIASAAVKTGGLNIFCGVSTNTGFAAGCGNFIYNTKHSVLSNAA